MCGRYVITSALEAIRETFGAGIDPDAPDDWAPNYNVSPSQTVPIVRVADGANGGGRRLAWVRWGLVPGWVRTLSTGGAAGLINARSETAAEKPSFRDAYAHRRCLVVADGYYEWKRAGRSKQPYLLAPADPAPMAFAGLWERWARDGTVLETCAILTQDATGVAGEVHDRMPVILDAADIDRWLGDTAPAITALTPWTGDRLTAIAVDRRVGNPRNNDARLLEPMRTLL